MYKSVFTKEFSALVAVLMGTTGLAKAGLSKNRSDVMKTAKVYSDYKAISEKEAELDVGTGENERKKKETLPTPPQHLTSKQAAIIFAYISRTILSRPAVITVPQVVNQPEVSTGVENFMISCQNKFQWRLKMNKIVEGMVKYGASGLLVIPRQEGIDFEPITPGNGFYNVHKKEGMGIIQKDYDFLMEMLDLNQESLTTLGKEIRENPEVLHHVSSANYAMGYHEITNDDDDGDCSGLTDQERANAFLASIPTPLSKDKISAYQGMHIKDDCGTCFADDGKFGKVSDVDKIKVLGNLYELTFNTVHLDSRLAKLDGIPNHTNGDGQFRKKYLIMSIHGFPIFVREITSEMIMMCDLNLSTDNETPETLVESLRSTETYNTDFNRSILLFLKDIVNQKNVYFDPDVFQMGDNGRVGIKSSQDMNGKAINPANHVYELSSPATNIAAISQTLPNPDAIANEVTGNNAMLSAEHVKGNRTSIESQSLTSNSESRFFVYAGNFFMTIVNEFASTAVDLLSARPDWIQVYDTQTDSMVSVEVDELVQYVKNYFREQTGLIPSTGGDPQIAQAIMNMMATIPELAAERDLGDVVTYFAKQGGWADFPELRRPHSRAERLNTRGAGPVTAGSDALTRNLAAGNQGGAVGGPVGGPVGAAQQGGELTPEEIALQQQQQV